MNKLAAVQLTPKVSYTMALLPDTQNNGLHMRREFRESFPRHRLQRKPLVSDPGMHQGTCVTRVPWCMSGSLTRGGRENIPAFPGAYATRNARIWQEADCKPEVIHIKSCLALYSTVYWDANIMVCNGIYEFMASHWSTSCYFDLRRCLHIVDLGLSRLCQYLWYKYAHLWSNWLHFIW